MRANRVLEMARRGERIVNGWLSISSPHIAEIMAHQGYDSLTIDLQHGTIDMQCAIAMMQAISTTDTVPMIRVPWNEPALLMRVLDAGAYGIVCPMINSADEAERFVAACRYPPRGFRSFGPNRATLYSKAGSSGDYARAADMAIALFAMIETRAGLENVEAIVKTPGLDGVYVGPGDLSLALGAPPSMAPKADHVLQAMGEVLSAAKSANLIGAAHTDGPRTAAQRFREGFQLCTLQNDARLLSDGAAAQVHAIRAEI